ncbi:MAP6 domain-containing protein 1 [Neosynchiropus ocellatus]
MAWPCISRVCCLARFWNQFDKSDLSVPLTVQNYSDIGEQEVRSVAKQVLVSERAAGGSDGGGTREASRVRREPGRAPRGDLHPPGEPFSSVTQYKQDFKPWPIPRKDNFPWIGTGANRAVSQESPGNSSLTRGHQSGETGEESRTSSYRQEYRPWTGVRPAKSAKKPAGLPGSHPGTEALHVPPETSYQAAYNAGTQRSAGPHHGGNPVFAAGSGVQSDPAATAAAAPISSDAHLPEPAEHRAAPRGEENLVRTKFPPNSSAVFQSGPRGCSN